MMEEARYFVQEVMNNEVDVAETGVNVDPEMQQDNIDCDLEGVEEDEQYVHLDPEGLKEQNIPDSGNWFRKLEVLDENVLQLKTCKLDKWQRQVVDNGLRYVRGLRKFASVLAVSRDQKILL